MRSSAIRARGSSTPRALLTIARHQRSPLRLSVVIPALDEERALLAVVAAVMAALGERALDLLIVDDGCERRDAAGVIARLAAADARVQHTHHDRPRGKGSSSCEQASRSRAATYTSSHCRSRMGTERTFPRTYGRSRTARRRRLWLHVLPRRRALGRLLPDDARGPGSITLAAEPGLRLRLRGSAAPASGSRGPRATAASQIECMHDQRPRWPGRSCRRAAPVLPEFRSPIAASRLWGRGRRSARATRCTHRRDRGSPLHAIAEARVTQPDSVHSRTRSHFVLGIPLLLLLARAAQFGTRDCSTASATSTRAPTNDARDTASGASSRRRLSAPGAIATATRISCSTRSRPRSSARTPRSRCWRRATRGSGCTC